MSHPSRDRGLAANLLVGPCDLDGPELVVEGGAFHHLVRVRRLEPGELLQLTDGRGRIAYGELIEVGRRHARIALGQPQAITPPAVRVELMVALPKPERAAWMVEKATEIGVARIRPIHTRRSTRRGTDGAIERLRRIAGAALEQSFGAFLPELDQPLDLTELLVAIGPCSPLVSRFLLDPSGALPHHSLETTGAMLAIGPEGGFDALEQELLIAAGFRLLGLGPRILRVETAAILGAGLLSLGIR